MPLHGLGARLVEFNRRGFTTQNKFRLEVHLVPDAVHHAPFGVMLSRAGTETSDSVRDKKKLRHARACPAYPRLAESKVS